MRCAHGAGAPAGRVARLPASSAEPATSTEVRLAHVQREIEPPQLLQSLDIPGAARRPTGMPCPATGAPAGLALRVVASSGEALPRRLLARLRAALPPCARVLNLYGSTEVAADATCLDASAWAATGAARAPYAPDRGAGLAGSPAAAAAAAAAVPSLASEPTEAGRGAGQDPTLTQSPGSAVPAGAPIDNTLVFIARLGACGGPRGGGAPGGAADAGALAAQDSSGPPPSGRPALALAALGEVGEVSVAGAGLAAGYLWCGPGPAAPPCPEPSQACREARQVVRLHAPPAMMQCGCAMRL